MWCEFIDKTWSRISLLNFTNEIYGNKSSSPLACARVKITVKSSVNYFKHFFLVRRSNELSKYNRCLNTMRSLLLQFSNDVCMVCLLSSLTHYINWTIPKILTYWVFLKKQGINFNFGHLLEIFHFISHIQRQ